MFPIVHVGIFDNFCDVKGVENLFTKNLLKVVRQILLKIIAIGELNLQQPKGRWEDQWMEK